MVRVIGCRDGKDVGYYINTTSRSGTWSVGLSPFYLGPVNLYDGYSAKNVENAWQYSKVYSDFADPGTQEPLPAYWAWARNGWDRDYADRYPMGKGAVPLYSLWKGERLSYIEARKKIYVPLYRDAVISTSAFARLKEVYEHQGEITLFDFDGYDHRKLGMSYEEVVNCPTKKMGHGFVLAMMLEGLL